MPETQGSLATVSWTDIVRIPPIEDKNKRIERVIRLQKAAEEADKPELLETIDKILTHIDDAEDLVSTALNLGRLLAPKLLTRFIPVVGWVLLAVDIANLLTSVLSLVPAGRRAKRRTIRDLKSLFTNKKARVELVNEFLKRKWGFGATIEALQAVEFLTGYGLSLGGIYGTLEDLAWNVIKSAVDSGKAIASPPPPSLAGKASRIMSQSYMLPILAEIGDTEGITASILATSLAVEELGVLGSQNFARAELIADQRVPRYMPWNPATRAALDEVGIPSDPDAMFNPFDPSRPDTYSDITSLWVQNRDIVEFGLSRLLGPTMRAAALQQVSYDAAIDMYNGAHDGKNAVVPEPTVTSAGLRSIIEFNRFPPAGSTPEQWLEFERALSDAFEINGTGYPDVGTLETVMLSVYGGWEEHPIGD